ncbi:hypothetical protein EYF80_056267 [Liparis tanakae]|uniref:Uncharacterized protein n=1 Tax=Liparis tanakae TaxID=230148 RepID=A0A4Z2EYB1_9TELE|nr:hypothetical protein EYF80_056267 [Liparis tanakae]
MLGDECLLTALRFRVQSSLHLFPSTTGLLRKISGLSLVERNTNFGINRAKGQGHEKVPKKCLRRRLHSRTHSWEGEQLKSSQN